jgi:hypothetical protein
MGLHENAENLDRRRWLRSRESLRRGEQGWDAWADVAHAWTNLVEAPPAWSCLAQDVERAVREKPYISASDRLASAAVGV